MIEALRELSESRRVSRAGGAKRKKQVLRLENAALCALEEILLDSGAKPADRIAAAKLTFEIAKQQSGAYEQEDTSCVHVIFDGMPTELAE